ncbi:type VI secretion system baseplate subunit TssG [Vibrio parahaemolyticus]|uniref:type VI secretion system baseplate subunit TssG n=1 Tax=Vibrio parahaemolyticus TaxID=670 RepID=UPI0002A5811C|nr:type VI secretion system baseplate subunit TssG [Vibrio parahaemolyticus]AGB12309.1 hypothetical protein VPBB_A0935 [Vibrio parahaemolyticus BB22OP]EGR0437612.1 type VI secretion system baseplate subunit TssG [Vibrio parahaemolyticus]EGR0766335.1 type VI secretion system baseplate subunit TssG [Vibrio parahaemolyticus]EGR2564236.1 type VI secretion system baseplate subunit TssG [Vibrio parahaemolyticus]EGR3223838.1 type VI secretion system baseplate subunit TssG [Vibrio parahaemolyticus]
MSTEDFYRELKQRSLFEAIHLIEQELLKVESQIGTDALPKNEKLNLKVNASLGFENAQLVSTKPLGKDKLALETNLIGLTGEQGVLPQHYSELALHRLKEGDHAMVDFYDIFNHRLLSLYYRSWQLSQLTIQARAHAKNQRSPLTDCMSSLTGGGNDLALHYGGMYASPTRSKGALKSILECLSGCQIRIHEFQGQWMRLSKSEQTRLVSKSMPEGQFAQLGAGASLGKKAWNINASTTIEFLPKESKQVTNLLPKTNTLKTIKQVAGDFIGKHKHVKWQLTTKHSLLPQVQISKQQGQLGVGSVLKKHERTEDRNITITV